MLPLSAEIGRLPVVRDSTERDPNRPFDVGRMAGRTFSRRVLASKWGSPAAAAVSQVKRDPVPPKLFQGRKIPLADG